MNALKANKFKVGDVVELTSLYNTVKHIGRADVMYFIGTKVVVTWVDATGEEVMIGKSRWLYHVDDLALVSRKEPQTYNPLIAQEGGGHYKNRGIQPLEYTMQNNLSFCEGNVVKYISRYKDKNGIEDLAKVIHYALLSAYEEYGEQGSTELKEKVLELLGEHG